MARGWGVIRPWGQHWHTVITMMLVVMIVMILRGSGSNKALGRTLAYGDPSWVSTWYLDPACFVLSRAIIKEEDGKKLNMSSIF